jgi:RNA recognition motif-containing protein
MPTDDASKLFVAGLPESITEDVLREIFQATGVTVVNVSLPKDRLTGRARGFGFVTLASPDQAAKARSSLDGSDQGGRSISVRPFSAGPQKRGVDSKPDTTAATDRTLYVGNLPFDMTIKDVEQLFLDNGADAVVRVHLPTGPDGRPRGFGFVTLGSAQAANSAVNALSNVDVKGRKLQVNLAHAKGDRPMGGGRPDPNRPPPDRTSVRPMPVRRDDGFGPPRPPESMPSGLAGGPPFEPRAPEGRRAKEKPEAKRRKRDKGKRRTERDEFHKRERGGGSTWAKWNRDWDDD